MVGVNPGLVGGCCVTPWEVGEDVVELVVAGCVRRVYVCDELLLAILA